MESITVISQGNSAVWSHVIDVNVLVKIHHELSFGMNLDQDLLLVHGFDNLTHITTLLLQMLQFFSQHPNFSIQFISLRLKSSHVLSLIRDCEHEFLNLGDVIRPQTISRGSSKASVNLHLASCSWTSSS